MSFDRRVFLGVSACVSALAFFGCGGGGVPQAGGARDAIADVTASDSSASDSSVSDTSVSDTSVEADSGAMTDAGQATDAGNAADVANTDASAGDGGLDCPGRPASCVSGTPGGQCGDALTPPTCVRGSWTCAPGTIPITECACVGRPPGSGCVCTPSGWSCGGGDAGTDSGARTFACGERLTCRSNAQYCYVFIGGAPGSVPSYSCMDLPAACGATPTCACLPRNPAASCSMSGGDLTVRVAAP
jgi:hypothetical protein